MNGASAEYVIITEPSFDAPRLTTMLVHACAATAPSITPAATVTPNERPSCFIERPLHPELTTLLPALAWPFPTPLIEDKPGMAARQWLANRPAGSST